MNRYRAGVWAAVAVGLSIVAVALAMALARLGIEFMTQHPEEAGGVCFGLFMMVMLYRYWQSLRDSIVQCRTFDQWLLSRCKPKREPQVNPVGHPIQGAWDD